jgi:excisionase family DNA binding protein
MTELGPPLLLRFEDAGKALSIGRTTVYQLVAEGQLEAVSIGRARRISTASLSEYVDRLRAEAREAVPAL